MATTDPNPTWTRREIASLGLAFDLNDAWMVETVPLPGGEVVRQKLPHHDGEAFVRYGDEETIDRFVAIQRDAVTTVAVITDEPVTLAGHPARRVMIGAERPPMRVYDYPAEGGFVDDCRPAHRRRLVVIGVTLHDSPVLLGYDVVADRLAAHQSALDRFLASAAIL